eukprot:CAMPEP_0113696680 /NCGR_PEP_ID=MMETSP0038_2-20120614/21654_1 /TAXON_ID=2898 /ORGANISM="Cryptomonas paramecium" /LENGTH=165 /DNA_ID=CAMNT_0000619489 /DNA_START=496 /DNA_END=993 /DNA_ORIENTATION=- /assembly_acc=CAM_ASM_000170
MYILITYFHSSTDCPVRAGGDDGCPQRRVPALPHQHALQACLHLAPTTARGNPAAAPRPLTGVRRRRHLVAENGWQYGSFLSLGSGTKMVGHQYEVMLLYGAYQELVHAMKTARSGVVIGSKDTQGRLEHGEFFWICIRNSIFFTSRRNELHSAEILLKWGLRKW